MNLDIFTVVTWILFLGLFPISFFWLRKAWLIGIKKDYSHVALKKGLPPKNPKKYAPYAVAINLLGGLVLFIVILLIIIAGLHYDTWTAIVGPTIWMKFIADFILSRQAHLMQKK